MSDDDGGMVVEPDISEIFFPEMDDEDDSTSSSTDNNKILLSGITKDMYTDLGGNRGYKCSICHKLLKSSSHLLGHIRTHTGEKPYLCEICDKTFSEASSLKVHMRIHTGERPFECKLCGKRFTQSCNMSSHMRRHESGTLPRVPMHHSHFEKKPNQHYMSPQQRQPSKPGTKCCVCEESFLDPDLLKIHEETHAPESPFQCSYCTSVFSLIKNLKAHVNRHLAFDANGREIYLRNTNVPPLVNGGGGMGNLPHPHYAANGMKLQPVQTNMGVKFIPQPMTTPKLVPIAPKPNLNISIAQKFNHHQPLSNNPMAPKLLNHPMAPKLNRPNTMMTPKLNPMMPKINPNIPALSLIPARTSMITKTPNGEKPYQCLQCKQFLVQSELSDHIKFHNSRRIRKPRHLVCKVCGKIFGKTYNLKRHLMVHSKQFMSGDGIQYNLSSEVDLVRKGDAANGMGLDEDFDDDDDDDDEEDEDEEDEISITPIKKEPMVININTDDLIGRSGKSIQEQVKEKVTKPVLKISAVASVDQNFLKKLEQLEYKRKLGLLPPPSYMMAQQRNSNGMAANKMIRLEARPPHMQQQQQHPSTSTAETDASGNPFQCKICGKTVSEAFSLKVHMRTHTGEKPFKCTLCQRQFTQSCNLNTHMRTHTGEKPFTCPFCTKTFTRSASMYGHMQVHVFRTANGIKMYKCSYCLNPFAKSAQLSGHIDTYLAVFKCCICQLQCNNADVLAKHQKVVHNKSITSSPPTAPPTIVPRSDREMPPLRLVPMSQLQQRLQPQQRPTQQQQPGGQQQQQNQNRQPGMIPHQQRLQMQHQRMQQHRLQQYRLQQHRMQQQQQRQQHLQQQQQMLHQQQQQQQQQEQKNDDDEEDDDEQLLLPDFLQPEVSMESGDEEELIYDGKDQKPPTQTETPSLKVVNINNILSNGNGSAAGEEGGSSSSSGNNGNNGETIPKLKIKLKHSDGESEEFSIQNAAGKNGNGNGGGGGGGGLYDSDEAEMDEDYDEDGYEGSDDGAYHGNAFEQTFNEGDENVEQHEENENENVGEEQIDSDEPESDEQEQEDVDEQVENEQENEDEEEEEEQGEEQTNEPSNEVSENGSSSDSKC